MASIQYIWLSQIRTIINNEKLQVIEIAQHRLWVVYLDYAIDSNLTYHYLLSPLQRPSDKRINNFEDLLSYVHVATQSQTSDVEKMAGAILLGQTLLIHKEIEQAVLFKTSSNTGRSISAPEIESQIIGPQSAFVESLEQNLQIVTKMLPDMNLKTKTVQLGTYTKTDISLLYVDGIAQVETVNQLLQRLHSLKIDGLYDSSMLLQYINDNMNSILPQMIVTERPDRAVSNLLDGKLILVVNGSSQVIITPCNIFDFFKSTEDLYINWMMASFLRLLRMGALIFSLLISPLYVAVLTFHYPLLPQNMLVSLIESRSKVPFAPVLETLFLEFIIELLREAGTRLPTKVGQTMGIVGGIVIGQATVQAGFTSNILIILVSLAALSTFIVPVYMMGAAIRLIRFPMILMAGFCGLLGIVFSCTFLLIHLLRLTSLNKPYLYPISPLRKTDIHDSFLRFPAASLHLRPQFTTNTEQTKLRLRPNPKRSDIYEEPLT